MWKEIELADKKKKNCSLIRGDSRSQWTFVTRSWLLASLPADASVVER